jgi:hypothetical protein
MIINLDDEVKKICSNINNHPQDIKIDSMIKEDVNKQWINLMECLLEDD